MFPLPYPSCLLLSDIAHSFMPSFQSSCRGSRRRWPSSWPTCKQTWGWATETTPWCPTRSWETARPTCCPRRTRWASGEPASSTLRASTSPTLRTRVLTEAQNSQKEAAAIRITPKKGNMAVCNLRLALQHVKQVLVIVEKWTVFLFSSWARGLSPQSWPRHSHTARLVLKHELYQSYMFMG